MKTEFPLPPGQVAADDFPRFGLAWFAYNSPSDIRRIAIRVAGDVETAIEVTEQLSALPHIDQVSDFHCVTSWSRRALQWRGVRFRDFYEQIVVPGARPASDASFVVFVCQDGYRNSLLLEDLLADDVMLADSLDGQPLTLEHGAPLRLVAPAHYAYKSAKHLQRIEFWRDDSHYTFPGPGFMSHPRARVALQERGRYLPGWFYRALYRPIIGFSAWVFRLGTAHIRRRQAAEAGKTG